MRIKGDNTHFQESESEDFCLRVGKQLFENSCENVKCIFPSFLEGHLKFLKAKNINLIHTLPQTTLLVR